jgi:hypothetical protein
LTTWNEQVDVVAPITVQKVVTVVLAAETFPDSAFSACFFSTIPAMIISDVGGVGFIFRFDESVLIANLPLFVLLFILELGGFFFPFKPGTDAASSQDTDNEEVTLDSPRRSKVLARCFGFPNKIKSRLMLAVQSVFLLLISAFASNNTAVRFGVAEMRCKDEYFDFFHLALLPVRLLVFVRRRRRRLAGA